MSKKHKKKIIIIIILIFLFYSWRLFTRDQYVNKFKVYLNVYLHHKEMEEYAIKCKEDHKYVNRRISKSREYEKEDFRYFLYADDSYENINRHYKNWKMWICDNEIGQYIVTFHISGWGLATSGYYCGAIYSPDDIDVFKDIYEGYRCEKTTIKIMDNWYYYIIEY